MKLKDCEIRELFVRGVAADVIFGREAVTEEQGAALLAEFRQIRPAARRVAYLSRDGWQTLSEQQTTESTSAPDEKAQTDQAPPAGAAPKARKAPARKVAS